VYPGQSSATINVYRTPTFSGTMVPFNIKVDGTELKKIMPDERVVLPIQPGDHRIQITLWSKQGSQTLHFHARDGEEIRFECHGAMVSLLHPITLQRVSSYDAPAIPGQARQPGGFAAGSPDFSGSPASPPARYQPPWASGPQSGAQDPQVRPTADPRVVEVVETGQFEEPLGEEVRLIDNRNSGTGVTRSVKASREWSRTLTVGSEQTRTLGAEVSGGVSWLKAKGNIESELQRTYSLENNSRHLFEEEITISVPERTSVRLVLRWKRIWQRGVVRLDQGDGTVTEVPYQVVVNVTFDQSQEDVGVGL
jgi:hypothetical protein